MKKVLTTTQFNLEQAQLCLDKEITKEQYLMRTMNYAMLMSASLDLGMFTPCVDGKPIEEPKEFMHWKGGSTPPVSAKEHKQCEQYQQAKEQVLFEGCEIVKHNSGDTNLAHSSGELIAHIIPYGNKDEWEWHWRDIEAPARQIDLKPTQAFLNKIGL